jgi:DNA-binding NarL/FixJ family response regulator
MMSVVLVCASGSGLPEALAVAGVDLLAVASGPDDVAALDPKVTVVELGEAFGVAAIVAVVRARPWAAVLAVAGRSDPAEALAAVRAGAAGYVERPDSAAALVDAVRRTAAGESVFSEGLADVVLAAQGAPSPAALTDREADVLRLVVEGLTARQIAARLVLSPRTVENHVRHVQGKLGLRGRAALVRYAIEQGLA